MRNCQEYCHLKCISHARIRYKKNLIYQKEKNSDPNGSVRLQNN